MSERNLPREAYELREGEHYVPPPRAPGDSELTLRAVLTGIALGILFGAANTYLGLRAGLTISTSIPCAVLTVVVFRALSAAGGGKPGLLEANLSQTIGSASSSVASGVLFTVPALYLWERDPELAELTLLAMCGGLLGVLAMIPLRRYLIAREHGKLPYPEGLACAEVLVASQKGGRSAIGVFQGLGFGIVVKLLTDGLKVVGGKFEATVFAKAKVAVSVSPALIGVGYILGPKIGSVMAGGAALSALVIIPIIDWWGASLDAPFYPETEKLIRDMSASEIWNRYVRYIGAGAVATAGFLTLIKSIPTMIESFKIGMSHMGSGGSADIDDDERRRDRDLSTKIILVVVAAILLVLTFAPGVLGDLDNVLVRALCAVLVAVFAFFFVTVSSRIVGIVGQTSNPTSGMTIATLLGTSALFWAFGWTDLSGKATALMVGTAVCIAASISGDASQDLKTGYLLGATPSRQQLGELVGVITSAGFVCLVVRLLDQGTPGGLGGEELPAPQGVLMKLVVDGVLDQNLPWPLLGIGVALALVAAAAKLPVLAFAVGVYLPLSTMAAVFCGGLLRGLLTRNQDEATAEARRDRGILFGSGLVGGAGLTGVLLALWVAANEGQPIQGLGVDYGPVGSTVVAFFALAVLLGVVARVAIGSRRG